MTNRFLDACRRRPVDRPPVWVMRQAGRYLPEYRAIRRKAGDFLTLCRTPELAAEVSLQPVRRFGLDAAIVFSDILTPLAPLGIDLAFTPGPRIGNPIRHPRDLRRLKVPVPWTGTRFLDETLELVRQALQPQTALIGFSGAPWTLASYLVEGTTSRSFTRVKKFALTYPDAFSSVTELLADAMAAYLRRQVEHGAQAIQIFDSWLGTLGREDAPEWALAPAARLLDQLGDLGVPRIYFANGASHLLDELASMPCEVISIDWRTSLAGAAITLEGHAIQGNLDPGVLMGPPAVIRRRTRTMLRAAPRTGYIANLGHGITPDVPVSHMATFVRTVQEYRHG